MERILHAMHYDGTWRWNGDNLGVLNRDAPDGIYSYDPQQDAEVHAIAKKYGREPGEFLRQLIGHGAFEFVHALEHDITADMICRPAIEIHTMNGCPHKCVYCGFGTVMVVMLNLEEFVERLDRLVRLNPWCKVFRYDINGEALALEPEFGACKMLVEYFASTDDRYLLIHSKSANVDHLLELDHRGHTIMLWSLTGDTVTRELERDSARTHEIIHAARKCQQAGYPVRFKFKPIIPIDGWRDECRDMIAQLFANVEPDVLTMCVLMWMDVNELKAIIPSEMLDSAFLRAAEESAGKMRGVKQGPFPHDVRAEIYRSFIAEIRKWDSDVPISLSTESNAMWRELAPLLGTTPSNYVCGCGPQCIPNCRKLDVNPWQVARGRWIACGCA